MGTSSPPLEQCVQVVHATPWRRRYRLRSSTSLDWGKFEAYLKEHFSARRLQWRMNRFASCVVVERAVSSGSRVLEESWWLLIGAMKAAGATPPPLPLSVIQVQGQTFWITNMLQRSAWLSLNILSFGLSLFVMGLATPLVVIGLAWMILPILPGGAILVLAYLLVELAFWMRRPFLYRVID